LDERFRSEVGPWNFLSKFCGAQMRPLSLYEIGSSTITEAGVKLRSKAEA
jgi:hypothetical protein